MATRKSFDFGAVNKVFGKEEKTSDQVEEKKIEEDYNKIKESTVDSSLEEPVVVTEQLERIDRKTDYRKAFNLKLVPRNKIVFHTGNDFPMEEIEKRAESILEIGLIHNLEALYDEDQGIYILESGEKRTRAIDMLIEKYGGAYAGDMDATDYKNYLKHVKQFEIEGYPVNVKYFDAAEYDIEEGSEQAEELKNIESQIRLNKANIDVVALDAAMIRKKIDETAALYTRRNALVKNPAQRVNVNKVIAEEMNISERQVMKYKAISKLIPELQELFDKKGITVNEGASYANLDEADQRQLLELLTEEEDKSEVKSLYEKLNRQQKEIESNQREILKLEEQKHAADKALADAERTAEQLELKIREEVEKDYLESEAAHEQFVKELQETLNDTYKKVKEYQKKADDIEKDKNEKVADLELKLAAKDKQALIAPTKIARTALKLDSIFESVQALMNQYEKALAEYRDIYAEDIGELPPEGYKEKWNKLQLD